MHDALDPRREADLARLGELLPNAGRHAWKGTLFTPARLANFKLSYEEEARGATVLESYPWKLTVEPSNLCNLRCPACFTGVGEAGRMRSHMSMELFEKALDELGPTLIQLELLNWGEPLLAKNIFPMLELAQRARVSTTIFTNFSVPFDEERAERLVASGLALLAVSADGARQETYEKYRVRGNFALVVKNCRLVAEAKKRLGSSTPAMLWDFHVFEHNVDDLPDAARMAADLGMLFGRNKGWVVGPEWETDKARFFMDPHPGRCHFLWHQGVINNDGGVAPCCGTFYEEDDLGRLAVSPEDLGAASFREIWNGERFQAARRLYQARSGPAGIEKTICYHCPVTKLWERWQAHQAAGGTLETLDVGSTNENFNFFWEFRKEPRPVPVALRRKAPRAGSL